MSASHVHNSLVPSSQDVQTIPLLLTEQRVQEMHRAIQKSKNPALVNNRNATFQKPDRMTNAVDSYSCLKSNTIVLIATEGSMVVASCWQERWDVLTTGFSLVLMDTPWINMNVDIDSR